MQCIVKKKRYVTLIEIMIVMFLIALITGVIAYNYRGALDQGKVFKTQAGIERLETILNLQISEHPEYADGIENSWKDVIKTSPLVKDPAALSKDGWGEEYKVTVSDGNIKVTSDKLESYFRTNPSARK